MLQHRIIDAHAHCGIQDRFPPQSLEDYRQHARGTPICGAVMFAPVMEIYDRYDPDFEDTDDWRARREAANHYLTTIGGPDFEVFPYFFMWNDFAVEQIGPSHRGIKWHRHADEPRYRYDDPQCRRAIDAIRERNMPVVLEEEMQETLRFVHDQARGVRVIIPHCGLLNGGYERLRDHHLWECPDVYADTALAPERVIRDYLDRYGPERIFFGSDFPFGDPGSELKKILRLGLAPDVLEALTGRNILRLLVDSNI
ncbi:MAG: amidohydrolase family protein [Syntrophobacteraceae bacterium]